MKVLERDLGGVLCEDLFQSKVLGMVGVIRGDKIPVLTPSTENGTAGAAAYFPN